MPEVNEPADDKLLEDYLHRKSALSLGYRKVYVEAPPPELDRAVKARAKRALRWLLPAAISLAIAIAVLIGINTGIHKWLDAMVDAERNLKKLRDEQAAEKRKKELEGPVVVAIDANSRDHASTPTQPRTRETWLAEIEVLRKAGRHEEADAELRKLQAAFPKQN